MVAFSQHVKTYFSETSLHGLKYITEEGRVVLERLLWVILVCSGMVLAVVFMLPGHYLVSTFHKSKLFELKESSNTSTTRPAPAWTPETSQCRT